MLQYQGVADKYIESYLWVKKCIEKGAVVYTPLVYKNPGGRRPGEEYVLFLLTCNIDAEPLLLLGELNSQIKMKSICVIGLQPRYPTKKLVDEPETVCTSNYAIW